MNLVWIMNTHLHSWVTDPGVDEDCCQRRESWCCQLELTDQRTLLLDWLIIRRKLLLCCTAGSPHNATHTLHHTTLSHCHSDLFINIPSYSTCGLQSNLFKLFNVNSSKLISWLIYIRCEAVTSCSEEDGSSLWWQLLKQITAYNSLAKYIQIMKLNFLGKHSIQVS